MRRFLSYYRQFEELSPDEVSRELRERRDEERRRHPAQQPPLDLSGAAWHQPPHPEVVNAATFALRRAVNEYPDAGPLQAAIAASHDIAPARVVVGHGAQAAIAASLDIAPARVVVGHGAGELLRAALHALAERDEVAVAWPGWGPLPGLVTEAGATPVPVALEELDGRRTTVLTRPADPTGIVVPHADLAGLAGEHWLILDEALWGSVLTGEDALSSSTPALCTRGSFSKAHAMAGFRIGYAVLPEGVELPLAPVLGVSAPAQAGARGRSSTGPRARAAAARTPPPSARGWKRRWPTRRSTPPPGTVRTCGWRRPAARSSPRRSPRGGSTSPPGTPGATSTTFGSRCATRRRPTVSSAALTGLTMSNATSNASSTAIDGHARSGDRIEHEPSGRRGHRRVAARTVVRHAGGVDDPPAPVASAAARRSSRTASTAHTPTSVSSVATSARRPATRASGTPRA